MSGDVWTIVANDHDHDDIGTTYFLIDNAGRPVSSCAWPMPLEQLATDLGASIRRASTRTGATEIDNEPQGVGGQ